MDEERPVRFEDLPDVLTPAEVAGYVHAHVKTIQAYCRQGRIRAVQFGRYYRIRREWLRDFLEQSGEE